MTLDELITALESLRGVGGNIGGLSGGNRLVIAEREIHIADIAIEDGDFIVLHLKRGGAMSFPKPRYESRIQNKISWAIFDTTTQCFVFNSMMPSRSETDRMTAALNREYQRWLTDQFYDEQRTEQRSVK